MIDVIIDASKISDNEYIAYVKDISSTTLNQKYQIIKEDNSKMPIIAVSAYALSEEIDKYGEIFDEYLTKPINENDLWSFP